MSHSPDSARPMTVDDFGVRRSYLSLLLGDEVAAQLLARTDTLYGTSPNDRYLSSVRFLNACLEHMQASGDEGYGVASHRVPLGTFGLMAAAAAQADDFEGALTRFVDAGRLLRPGIVMQAARGRDGLTLSLRHEGERSARAELMVECFAVTVHCAFRWLTGRKLRVAQIKVAEPLPGFERSMLNHLLGCPVGRQATGVTMRYAPEAATIPLEPVKYQTWAAQELTEFLCLLDEGVAAMNAAAMPATADIVTRVRQAVGAGMRSGAAAAQALGMSPATLRRRLSEAGHSFRAIAADLQRSAVESLIVTDKPLEDIAAEIGYSDVRSLRRACRRWFGVTPTAYRHGRRRARSSQAKTPGVRRAGAASRG